MLRWTLIGLIALAAVPALAGIRGKTWRVNKLQIGWTTYDGKWDFDSPTIRSKDGYLTYDVTGQSRKVTFGKERGDQTTWAFVERTPFLDESSNLEQKGYTLKIQATEGPFKGWYLGRAAGEFVLVEKRRDSVTLRLIQEETEIRRR
jgi:hypothetical protein